MPFVNRLILSKPSKGRRLAISDVHGCSKTFNALVKKVDLQKNDQLFLLGDMIHRGPGNHKVLNKILKLQKKGFQVFYIRGNHEQTVLNTLKKSIGQRKRALIGFNSIKLLKEGHLKNKYKKLLKSSYHYIELDDYILVHAGFNDRSINPFEDSYSMLNTRDFKVKKLPLKGKTLIIGHRPTDISKIRLRIEEGRAKLNIDNGCSHPKSSEQGNLVCFDLDSRKLSLQKNIEH